MTTRARTRAARVTEASPVRALQRWFQAAIMHPGGTRGATADRSVRSLLPRPARALEEVLEPSRELDAKERLEVYASSYFLRLRDVMKTDFPGVLHALGEDGFDRAVREYVTRHPSQSFTLNDLGARFSAFLAKEARAPEVARRRAFLAELATLERAVEEVFHEPEAAPVDVARLQSIPAERWTRARFQLQPAARLFAFAWPVDPYLQDVLERKSPRLPRPRPTWLVVYRHDWRSWRVRLTREQFQILSSLRRGRTLGTALAAALAQAGPTRRTVLDRLHRWFRDWTSDGLFVAVDLPAAARGRGAARLARASRSE